MKTFYQYDETKSIRQKQTDLIKFARKYCDGRWNTFHDDYETVSLICATANLGIIEVKNDMFTLKSRDAADQFLNR